MIKRVVLGITGIRSEYDIMSSVFKAIDSHPELDLQVAVTGAHLSKAYGYTVEEIRKDGFSIVEEVESLLSSDGLSGRVKGLAIQLQGLIQTVSRIKPDFLLVLGDREESISTALIGAYMNIPIAHIGGGDRVVGNVDDQIRHAVTKLSHLHFVTSMDSESRIIGLGEQPFRIFNVGNPGLDRFVSTPFLTLSALSKKISFNLEENEPFILMIQHVISSESIDGYIQIKKSLDAIQELGIKTIIIYPNSDSGSHGLIRAINEYKELPFILVGKNFGRLEFVNLLRNASCILGNSSAGILEAPYLKLPAVNVGNRQLGRMHADNVQFVGYDKSEIKEAIKKAIYDEEYRAKVWNCTNPYGDGTASSRIADVLASVQINKALLVKDITF